MKDLASRQGQRLFAVHLPSPADDPTDRLARTPSLIFRSFDEGDESRVQITADVPVSIEGRMALTYCPACGRRLMR